MIGNTMLFRYLHCVAYVVNIAFIHSYLIMKDFWRKPENNCYFKNWTWMNNSFSYTNSRYSVCVINFLYLEWAHVLLSRDVGCLRIGVGFGDTGGVWRCCASLWWGMGSHSAEQNTKTGYALETYAGTLTTRETEQDLLIYISVICFAHLQTYTSSTTSFHFCLFPLKNTHFFVLESSTCNNMPIWLTLGYSLGTVEAFLSRFWLESFDKGDFCW